jgi:hypothetical protein
MSIQESLSDKIAEVKRAETKGWFQRLIQVKEYVGELYSINYEFACAVIHDRQRKDVGGIPNLSFLIASRIDPAHADNVDYRSEDASFILLRVMDSAPLPQDTEAERIRVETAQKVSGETERHWDSSGVMDAKTRVLFGYAGVRCRIIGTFFLEENTAHSEAPLDLKFGSDISNYYPNRGLKVYKPNAQALEEIVNYCDPTNRQEQDERYHSSERVKLGCVRYASTNRKYQHIDNVDVRISPADLLSQKSALFGMTRTGKSNTTKIIAKSVFELRNPKNRADAALRIGQIIFDPNGEYANENAQDTDGRGNPNALKNVWRTIPNARKENEVITYGITKHPNDPDRVLMLLNFYLDENLQTGKEIIDSVLADDSTAYIKNFAQVHFEKPDENDQSATTRYKRRVLAYRSVLARAGFPVPEEFSVSTKRLFNKDLLDAMQNTNDNGNAAEYKDASDTFSRENPTLHQLANAFESLDKFIRDKGSSYHKFESKYATTSSSGDRWADEDFKKIIGVFSTTTEPEKSAKPLNSTAQRQALILQTTFTHTSLRGSLSL